MKLKYLFIIIISLLAACKSQVVKQHDNEKINEVKEADEISGESIFNLTSAWYNEEGQALHLADLKGKVLVIVMIYTSCQAACPRLVADIKDLHAKVPARLSDKVQYILVSIDPLHDTPEKLKSFAISRGMDGNEWTFLQGTPGSVREFANVLSVKYKEISPANFSHSNIISVFSEGGELVHQAEGLGVNNKETIEAIIKTTEEL